MRIIILSLIIITCTSPVFAQDTIQTLRTQIESATSDSDRVNAIANSNAFDPIGFYNLGNGLARLGRNEAAIAAYRKAITQRKGFYSRALNNLSVVLLRMGRWDEAQEALTSALRIENFRYAEASYNLGRVYAARGQNDLAAREWRRVLAIDPQHEGAKQALAAGDNEERIVVAASPSVKTVSKSPAAPAKTLTIDQAEVRTTPGKRATDTAMNLTLRSSQGGQHTIVLPEDAQLLSVTIDGAAQPIRQDGRNVTLPLKPGTQQATLSLRSSSGLGMLFRTPEVDLAAGVYSFTCRIVAQDSEGALIDHFESGMHASVRVED